MNVGRLLEIWRRRFPGPPTVLASAPGRVNLIGEHTDYNLGYVLPAATAERTHVLARRSDRKESTVISTDKRSPAVFRLRGEKRGKGWTAYVRAVGLALRDVLGTDPPEIEAIIASTLPRGAGLSSSAALEVALAAAWARLAGADPSPREVAEVAWRAEHDFVGVPCGKMDQYASALGQEGCALLIDTRTMEARPIPLPHGLVLAVLDTRVRRALAGGEYARRVEECARAVLLLREAGRQVDSLRDATPDDLAIVEQTGDEVAFRRARHVVLENERVLAFADALERQDICALGSLMAASHASLRDDYEVSSPELDAMVRAAASAPGCVGARMTGAGFGGCCIALVAADRTNEFLPATLETYKAYGFPEPSLRWTTPSRGVDVLEITKPST